LGKLGTAVLGMSKHPKINKKQYLAAKLEQILIVYDFFKQKEAI
jgi:hypothetical protein